MKIKGCFCIFVCFDNDAGDADDDNDNDNDDDNDDDSDDDNDDDNDDVDDDDEDKIGVLTVFMQKKASLHHLSSMHPRPAWAFNQIGKLFRKYLQKQTEHHFHNIKIKM